MCLQFLAWSLVLCIIFSSVSLWLQFLCSFKHLIQTFIEFFKKYSIDPWTFGEAGVTQMSHLESPENM